MLLPADSYLEYKEIPPGTPDWRMQFYIDTVNNAYQENRKGKSKMYDEIMDVSLTDYFKVEMDGKLYVCLHWQTYKPVPKEDFFFDQSKDG